MKLVTNWQQAWRLNSVQAAAALAFLSALQANVLPQIQSLVPVAWWPWVTGTVALLIIILRLRDQPDVSVGAPAADASKAAE